MENYDKKVTEVVLELRAVLTSKGCTPQEAEAIARDLLDNVRKSNENGRETYMRTGKFG